MAAELWAWMSTPQALATGCWALALAVVLQTVAFCVWEIGKAFRRRQTRSQTLNADPRVRA